MYSSKGFRRSTSSQNCQLFARRSNSKEQELPFTYLLARGSVFRVHCPGFRVQGSGCRAHGSGSRVQGSGFRVQGSGCRVQLTVQTRQLWREKAPRARCEIVLVHHLTRFPSPPSLGYSGSLLLLAEGVPPYVMVRIWPQCTHLLVPTRLQLPQAGRGTSFNGTNLAAVHPSVGTHRAGTFAFKEWRLLRWYKSGLNAPLCRHWSGDKPHVLITWVTLHSHVH